MTDNHSTTTPRTMRLERRGILYGVSVLTPEGWLVFDTPTEGFGKMSPEQWVLARLRAMKARARTSSKPKPRQTSHATHTSSSNHSTFMRNATAKDYEMSGFSEVRQLLIMLEVARGPACSKQPLDGENLLLRFQQKIFVDDIQRFISVVSPKKILIQWFSLRSQSATSLLPFNILLI